MPDPSSPDVPKKPQLVISDELTEIKTLLTQAKPNATDFVPIIVDTLKGYWDNWVKTLPKHRQAEVNAYAQQTLWFIVIMMKALAVFLFTPNEDLWLVIMKLAFTFSDFTILAQVKNSAMKNERDFATENETLKEALSKSTIDYTVIKNSYEGLKDIREKYDQLREDYISLKAEKASIQTDLETLKRFAKMKIPDYHTEFLNFCGSSTMGSSSPFEKK